MVHENGSLMVGELKKADLRGAIYASKNRSRIAVRGLYSKPHETLVVLHGPPQFDKT
jgi:hypothetical protein